MTVRLEKDTSSVTSSSRTRNGYRQLQISVCGVLDLDQFCMFFMQRSYSYLRYIILFSKLSSIEAFTLDTLRAISFASLEPRIWNYFTHCKIYFERTKSHISCRSFEILLLQLIIPSWSWFSFPDRTKALCTKHRDDEWEVNHSYIFCLWILLKYLLIHLLCRYLTYCWRCMNA